MTAQQERQQPAQGHVPGEKEFGPHQVEVQVAGVQVLQRSLQGRAHILHRMVRVPAAQGACRGIRRWA
jgi:hypothetical protein